MGCVQIDGHEGKWADYAKVTLAIKGINVRGDISKQLTGKQLWINQINANSKKEHSNQSMQQSIITSKVRNLTEKHETNVILSS